MPIPAHDTAQIAQWNDRLTQTVELGRIPGDDPRSQPFEAFVDALSELAPKVRVALREAGPLPGLTVGAALTFHAIPEERELPPFLELAAAAATGEIALPEGVRERVEALGWPAEITLFVSAQCPYCPQVVRQLAPLGLVGGPVRVRVIDGWLFPELAQAQQIRSVPTVLLDDQFRWTGSVAIDEVLQALVERDPTRMSEQALIGILKDGNADWIAQTMLRHEVILPAFPALVAHPEWSVRLGAMVVAETLAETAPELARQMLDPLWSLIGSANSSAQGDIITLFGLLATPQWRPKLEALLETTAEPDVREAIREAIDRMPNG